MLEIGPASGVATEVLAEWGVEVVAVELGSDLARQARANLASFDNVQVVTADIEQWEPDAWGSFDLVVAATAWHWIDPERRWTLAHRHLRPGGHLATWSATHVIPVGGDRFFEELQPVYVEIGAAPAGPWIPRRPTDLDGDDTDLIASGRFDLVATTSFDWEISYDAEGYIDLLRTFSGHIAMSGEQRSRLFAAIRERLALRDDGRLRRHWGSVLTVGRARPLSGERR